jgi:hypothetical protein
MSLDDDFDKIGGPLQKPVVRKKPTMPKPEAADATSVKLGQPPIDADAKERAIRASQKPITADEIAASKMGKNTAR